METRKKDEESISDQDNDKSGDFGQETDELDIFISLSDDSVYCKICKINLPDTVDLVDHSKSYEHLKNFEEFNPYDGEDGDLGNIVDEDDNITQEEDDEDYIPQNTKKRNVYGFQREWLKDKNLATWLEKGERPGFVYCKYCETYFSMGTGKAELFKHRSTPRHKECEQTYIKLEDCDDPPITKRVKKRKIDRLLHDPALQPWLCEYPENSLFCNCCKAYLRGTTRKDLLKHAKAEKHIRFMENPNQEPPKKRKPYTFGKKHERNVIVNFLESFNETDSEEGDSDGITDPFDECFIEPKVSETELHPSASSEQLHDEEHIDEENYNYVEEQHVIEDLEEEANDAVMGLDDEEMDDDDEPAPEEFQTPQEVQQEEDDELPIPVYSMDNRVKFQKEWNEDSDLNTWLVEKQNNSAFCIHCKCFLRIGAGKKDLLKHVKTLKHKRNAPLLVMEAEYLLDENVESNQEQINEKTLKANDVLMEEFDDEDKNEDQKPENRQENKPELKKSSPRPSKFTSLWKTDPELKDWISEQRGSAFCKICSVYLRVASGKKDLIRHKMSNKHKLNEENIIKEMCRICLEYHDLKFMPSIWDRDKFIDMKIFKKIMHCTGIVIKKGDEHPDKICLSCADKLNDTYNFQRTCEYSEKYFENAILGQQGVELTMPKLVETFPNVTVIQSNPSKQIPATNIISSSIATKHKAKPESSPQHISKKIKLEPEETAVDDVEEQGQMVAELDGEEYVADDHFESSFVDFNDGSTSAEGETISDLQPEPEKTDVTKTDKSKLETKSKSKSNKENKKAIPESLIAAFIKAGSSTKSYRDESKVIRNIPRPPPTEEVFICDICGNTYDKKAKLSSHLKNHSDVRPYPCEICKKSFKQSSQLIVHMRTHTGEKPLACRYCDRKFAEHSSRIRHERLHRNEKPYVCDECGRAFTYATALKVHRVVHTGEKNFHCLPCGKSFPQKHNLTNHINTISHRNCVKALEDQSLIEKHEVIDEEHVEYATIASEDIMNVEVDGSTVIYAGEQYVDGVDHDHIKTEHGDIYHRNNIKLIPADALTKIEEYTEIDDGQQEVVQVTYAYITT